MDKHWKAHSDLHDALRDIVEAIELMESSASTDEATKGEIRRRLGQARMYLQDARLDMRLSRLKPPAVP